MFHKEQRRMAWFGKVPESTKGVKACQFLQKQRLENLSESL